MYHLFTPSHPKLKKLNGTPYLQTRHFKGNDKPYFSTNEKLNRSTGFRERAEKLKLKLRYFNG
ncbi:hypothetical protein C0J52_08823 [Blattella germanica]|nr:hypothetical protein C0J52_08823 [Blattella germanica]